jgi:hypothetical protein
MKYTDNHSARLATLRMAENAARSAFACNFETADAYEAKRVEEWHKAHRFTAWFKRLMLIRFGFQGA